jgi:hypothetical protein
MAAKGCVGCLRDVEDTINSPGIATICESCRIPTERVKKDFSMGGICVHCKGKTNFIGIFRKGEFALAYFDCPNPNCSRKRMTIALVGKLFPRN